MPTGLMTRLLCALVVFPRGSSVANAAWIVQDSPLPEASFRAVQVVNARVAWIGGSGGACLRTVDGGKTWEVRAVAGAEALDFRGLAAFDKQTALLVSAGPAEQGRARIYRTANGGATWQLVFQTQEKGVFLDGVAFWDARNGLVFGDPVDGKWYLLRTRDGGRNWQRIAPENLPPVLPTAWEWAGISSAIGRPPTTSCSRAMAAALGRSPHRPILPVSKKRRSDCRIRRCSPSVRPAPVSAGTPAGPGDRPMRWLCMPPPAQRISVGLSEMA
jgi:hypothetical protein